jgi:hypothetical protein
MQLTLIALLALSAEPPARLAVSMVKDVPGMVSPPTLPQSTTVDGIGVTQTSCVSKAPLGELKSYFRATYQKAGLYLAEEAEDVRPEKGEQVTGLDTENLISYTVLLQPSGKLTTVVMAVAQLGGQKLQQSSDAIAPVFPGGEHVTSVLMEGAKAMSYSAKATPAELKAFYKETLTKAGWVEKEPMAFVKNGQELTVSVAPGVTERYVVIQIQALGGP